MGRDIARPGATGRLEGKDFVNEKAQVFEVSWDTGWDDDPETMAGRVSIREMSEEDCPELPIGGTF